MGNANRNAFIFWCIVLLGLGVTMAFATDAPNVSCGNTDKFSCYQRGSNTPGIENQNHWNVASVNPTFIAYAVPTNGRTPAVPNVTPGTTYVNCCYASDPNGVVQIYLAISPVAPATPGVGGTGFVLTPVPLCLPAVNGDCPYQVASTVTGTNQAAVMIAVVNP